MILKSHAKFEENELKKGIWKTFNKALESLKIGTFMASFCPKQRMYELNIHRGAMCHDNEKQCKS